MRRSLAVLACAALATAACGGGEERGITVSAASSLTDAFTEIGAAFEQANRGVTVTFNFGPSDGLATQINDRAPVDVFASASPAWMDAVQDVGPGVSGRSDFASNQLAIIVPAGGPAAIDEIDDLARDGVQLVIAAEGVPAGDYAREALERAGILEGALDNVVSNAEDVRAVVTAVASGEADAGIVYATDVTSDVADRVSLVDIPDDVNITATYPIAVVTGSEEADLAQRFVDYVLGDGQRILAEHRFLPVA